MPHLAPGDTYNPAVAIVVRRVDPDHNPRCFIEPHIIALDPHRLVQIRLAERCLGLPAETKHWFARATHVVQHEVEPSVNSRLVYGMLLAKCDSLRPDISTDVLDYISDACLGLRLYIYCLYRHGPTQLWPT